MRGRPFDDGSAGDVDYGRIGVDYAKYRRPDARIEAMILQALGSARSILNVGAGAGSYEPTDREVTPVEPSAAMRAQRPGSLAAAVDAVAEDLPFHDDAFDGAMATFTVHQWSDLRAGLGEVRRVTRGPVVVLTCDPDALDRFWLQDYAPELLAAEAQRYPTIPQLVEALAGTVEVETIPIPLDCTDGFVEAYYGRPERLLDPAVRLAQSAWSFVDEGVAARAVEQLAADITRGAWDRRHGRLRSRAEFHGSLRLVVGRPDACPRVPVAERRPAQRGRGPGPGAGRPQ